MPRNVPTSRFIRWSLAGIIVVLGAWSCWWYVAGADLESIQKLVRTRFPKVRQISTGALADWLVSKSGKPLLLDVRNPDEYAISHLSGAQRIDPKASGDKLDLGVAKDAPIVTYCSVGYRSSDLAQRLQAAGYTNVQNLEGSIFKWANEDRPLVGSGGKPADKVHPYDSHWGKLVKPERRAEMPSAKP